MTSLPLNCFVDFLVWTDYKHPSVNHYYSELTLSCWAAVPQYFLPRFGFFSCSFHFVCLFSQLQPKLPSMLKVSLWSLSQYLFHLFFFYSVFICWPLILPLPSYTFSLISFLLKIPFLTLLSFELITDQQSNSVWTYASDWTKCKIL